MESVIPALIGLLGVVLGFMLNARVDKGRRREAHEEATARALDQTLFRFRIHRNQIARAEEDLRRIQQGLDGPKKGLISFKLELIAHDPAFPHPLPYRSVGEQLCDLTSKIIRLNGEFDLVNKMFAELVALRNMHLDKDAPGAPSKPGDQTLKGLATMRESTIPKNSELVKNLKEEIDQFIELLERLRPEYPSLTPPPPTSPASPRP